MSREEGEKKIEFPPPPEKVDFLFGFEEKDEKLKKLEKFLFPAFLRLVRYEYCSKRLVHFISTKNPKNIRFFMRKGGGGGGFLRF